MRELLTMSWIEKIKAHHNINTPEEFDDIIDLREHELTPEPEDNRTAIQRDYDEIKQQIAQMKAEKIMHEQSIASHKAAIAELNTRIIAREAAISTFDHRSITDALRA